MRIPKKTISSKLTKENHELLKEFCIINGYSIAQTCTRLINEYVKANESTIDYYIAHTAWLRNYEVKSFLDMELKDVRFTINGDTYKKFKLACKIENKSVRAKLNELVGDYLERNS